MESQICIKEIGLHPLAPVLMLAATGLPYEAWPWREQSRISFSLPPYRSERNSCFKGGGGLGISHSTPGCGATEKGIEPMDIVSQNIVYGNAVEKSGAGPALPSASALRCDVT